MNQTSQPAKPLPPHLFLVMLVLSEGPRHGYSLKQMVAERSGGAVDLDPGGLYRLIARMEESGWVRPLDAPPEGADSADARRRYYALTERGRAALAEEARRMAALVRMPAVEALLARESAG